MQELWMAHYSIGPWQEPSRWTGYLDEVQRILGSPLTHLDVNDPVKRKVGSLADAGHFVCAFKPREDSRWLFGKFADIGIELSVRHYRELGRWPNSFKWHVPWSFAMKSKNSQQLRTLFDLGNRAFRPFYAFCDDVAQIENKKKPSGSIDMETELHGIFWLTYFNATYVEFFGKDRFNGVSGVECSSDGGITIALGESPELVSCELREQTAEALGNQSFVNPIDIFGKPRGRFVLTFPQLLGSL